MAELKNQLTWSYSRMRQFCACKRQYYYHRYLKWGGWKADAPKECRDAYRLSKMKSLSILAGELVHKGIEEVLLRYRQNRVLISEPETIASAKLRWDKALSDSTSGRWRSEPKLFTCLLEDYYRHPARDETAEKKWDCVETSLTNFFASKTWEHLKRSNPSHWRAMDGDPFATSEVEGIPMYGRPDIGYGAKSNGDGVTNCRVFDWKTGRPREQDMMQLRYYVIFAEDAWGFPHGSVKARLIYLYPDYQEVNREIPEEELIHARIVLKSSFADMRNVLSDVDENIPLDISHFPITERKFMCRHCSYQEICGERHRDSTTSEDDDDENFND